MIRYLASNLASSTLHKCWKKETRVYMCVIMHIAWLVYVTIVSQGV